jgi:thioesterase domain-containing protein
MLTNEKDRVLPNTLVEVSRGGTGTPIYFPPGAFGEGLVTPLIRDALPGNVPVYAFRRPLGAPLEASMEAMAARFCADLESWQPEGAVSLVGYSFAGLLAYEMARQLKTRGRDIKLLVIFDTGPQLSAGGGARGAATRTWLFLKNLPLWIYEDLIRSLDRDTVGRLRRSLQKHVRARFRYRSAVPGFVPKVEHLFDVGQWSPEVYALVENNLKILGAFEYRPYDGEIVLFRARARPLFHPQTWDLGWQSLTRSVRVIPATGNHHTMMHEPHVRVVARGLGAVVRASESGV